MRGADPEECKREGSNRLPGRHGNIYGKISGKLKIARDFTAIQQRTGDMPPYFHGTGIPKI